MKLIFKCENAERLKELMIDENLRNAYRVEDDKLKLYNISEIGNMQITFPRDIILVGNEREKFLWV